MYVWSVMCSMFWFFHATSGPMSLLCTFRPCTLCQACASLCPVKGVCFAARKCKASAVLAASCAECAQGPCLTRALCACSFDDPFSSAYTASSHTRNSLLRTGCALKPTAAYVCVQLTAIRETPNACVVCSFGAVLDIPGDCTCAPKMLGLCFLYERGPFL